MREFFGRNAFTPHIREAIIERKKQVVRYFKVKNTTFKSNGGSAIKRQFVFTEDLELLLDFVISERDYEKAIVDVKVSLTLTAIVFLIFLFATYIRLTDYSLQV